MSQMVLPEVSLTVSFQDLSSNLAGNIPQMLTVAPKGFMTSSPQHAANSAADFSASYSSMDSKSSRIMDTSAPSNMYSGVMSTSTPANMYSGVMSTSTPANMYSGITSTSTPANMYSGITGTSTPANMYSGITSTSTPKVMLDVTRETFSPVSNTSRPSNMCESTRIDEKSQNLIMNTSAPSCVNVCPTCGSTTGGIMETTPPSNLYHSGGISNTSRPSNMCDSTRSIEKSRDLMKNTSQPSSFYNSPNRSAGGISNTSRPSSMCNSTRSIENSRNILMNTSAPQEIKLDISDTIQMLSDIEKSEREAVQENLKIYQKDRRATFGNTI